VFGVANTRITEGGIGTRITEGGIGTRITEGGIGTPISSVHVRSQLIHFLWLTFYI